MKKLLQVLLVTLLGLSLVSCGKKGKKLVSGIDVSTRDRGSESFVITDFTMELGETELPFLHFSLLNDLGTVRLFRNNGKNHVALDLNLNEIFKLPRGEAELPNGTPVPVDTNGAGIIEIPINGVKGKVYVAHAGDTTLVGFAFSIKQLGEIGNRVGRAGVFPAFSIGKYNLTAGVYTGDLDEENGIAAFASLGTLSEGKAATGVAGYDFFRFINPYTPRWKRRTIYKNLRYISRKTTTLDLVLE